MISDPTYAAAPWAEWPSSERVPGTQITQAWLGKWRSRGAGVSCRNVPTLALGGTLSPAGPQGRWQTVGPSSRLWIPPWASLLAFGLSLSMTLVSEEEPGNLLARVKVGSLYSTHPGVRLQWAPPGPRKVTAVDPNNPAPTHGDGPSDTADATPLAGDYQWFGKIAFLSVPSSLLDTEQTVSLELMHSGNVSSISGISMQPWKVIDAALPKAALY